MPARGPEPISARSLAIFVSETATTLSAPLSSTSASRLPWASNGSSGARDREPGLLAQERADALGELGVSVEAGAGGGAAKRDLRDLRQRVGDAAAPEPDLCRVARELLPERYRHGVHQVGAAGFDDVGEGLGLVGERALEPRQRRQQGVRRLVEGGEVHGRGKDVVGRLAEVDVVVGVDALAGEVGDDLVGVHVRRRPRAGLEDVDRELLVVAAVCDLGGGGGDALSHGRVDQAQIGIHLGGGALDPAEPVNHRQRHALTRDLEVGDRLGRLAAPELGLLIGRCHGRQPMG